MCKQANFCFGSSPHAIKAPWQMAMPAPVPPLARGRIISILSIHSPLTHSALTGASSIRRHRVPLPSPPPFATRPTPPLKPRSSYEMTGLDRLPFALGSRNPTSRAALI